MTQQGRITRHKGIDRLLHWLMAAAVIALMATSLLPILGMEFSWVAAHWISGLVLTGAVIVHIVRSLFFRSLEPIWFGSADLADVASIAKWNLRIGGVPPRKPGKYSPAQKLIHHAFALVVLAAVVTGLLMMVKVETPFWTRNPYFLDNAQWGIVHVVHGLSALLLITMIMTHVYFALRPEKLHFLRAMLRGWITSEEHRSYHDRQRWRINE